MKEHSKPDYVQSPLEDVLDFCVALSERMIVSGANLERVQLAIARICHTYHLHDMALHLLSTFISLSARDEQGHYAVRQRSIPASGIHLERLQRLNRLSYAVCEAKPNPRRLSHMLETAYKVKEYPDWLILLSQMAAMCCLCLIFGGGVRELLPVVAVTAVIHYASLLFAHTGIDHILTNAFIMFFASIAAVGFVSAGLSAQGPVIIITVSMLMIPGIPLVNSVRNLLCGNEMNGILQLIKVTVETMSLGVGIYLAVGLMGYWEGMEHAVVNTLTTPLALVALSFLASAGFGVVFRIPAPDLWKAGLGGMLTRIVLLAMQSMGAQRITYITVAALFAALYGELLATMSKDPSTYFVYPSIVPLIPGDLFYYSIVGLYIHDRPLFESSLLNCLIVLFGMSIGFVLSFTIAHYVRKWEHHQAVRRQRRS